MGKSYKRAVGSRAEVWHGTADHTSGGLHKKDLYKNKHGRIVSLKKHHTAKRERRLLKHGYGTKKGHFGYFKREGSRARHHGHRSRKYRGGHAGVNTILTPSQAAWDGQGIDGQGLYVGSSFSGPETAALNASGGSRRKHRNGTAKRRKKHELHFKDDSMYGGHAGVTTTLTPSQAAWDGEGIDGQGLYVGSSFSGPETAALNASGGRKRRRRRKH